MGPFNGIERTLCVPITERRVTHVAQLDVTLRARVHEKVAMNGVELGRGDDFGQFLHIHGLDVDDVCEYVIRGDRGMGRYSTH